MMLGVPTATEDRDDLSDEDVPEEHKKSVRSSHS